MTVVAARALRPLALVFAVLGLLTAQVWFAGPARAANVDVYDGIPATLAPNYPSLGYDATSTAEFGDLVELGGTARDLQTITVGFSSWACESGSWNTTCTSAPGATFTHPVTVNVYAEGVSPLSGALLATVTSTITAPYRPSAEPRNCTTDPKQWFDATTSTCVNGVAFTASFDFSALDVTLPDRVIVAIAYNTFTHGAAPLTTGGPYDSLNVALASTAPATGVDVDADAVFWNTTFAANYTDGGAAGTGVLRADTGWTPYSLLVDIVADDGTQLPTLADPGSSGGLPTLAATGSEPSPFTLPAGLAAVLLGVVLVAIAPRRRAHRA